MIRRITLLILPLLMLTVPASFAAVDIAVDDVTGKGAGDQITIPVQITGYENFLAAELVFDFDLPGNFEDLSIINGDMYGKIVDYGQFGDDALESDWTGLNGWYSDFSNAAAVDYRQVGSKLKIYLYAPEPTAKTNGTLFSIQAGVGQDSNPGILSLGGRFFNFSQSTRDLAEPALTSFLFDQVAGSYLGAADKPKGLANATQAELKAFQNPLDVGPSNGAIDQDVTMVGEDGATQIKLRAKLQNGSKAFIDKGLTKPFTGVLKPPKVMSPAELQARKQDFSGDFKQWQDQEDLVGFRLGSAEKVFFDKPVLTVVELVKKSADFQIYFLPVNGGPVLAGVDWSAASGLNGTGALVPEGTGWTSKNKTNADIQQGGTIFASQEVNATHSKYSVALLLSHMSDYVAASSDTGGGDEQGDCFIATAAFGTFLDPHVKVLRDFRDQYLLTNTPGRKFVELYYTYSPPVADFIAAHDSLRFLTRLGLMPLFGLGYLLVHTSLGWAGVFLGIGVLCLTPLLFWRRRSATPV
ncbi:MAG: hypothetical protein K9J81_01005 [Desulfohalobiaceae bacterium]|nr:hypothetical protein [Desulfohalobiaceae bacterium]